MVSTCSERDPEGGREGRPRLDGGPCPGDALRLVARGAPTVDYGNNIRQMAFEEGVKDASDLG